VLTVISAKGIQARSGAPRALGQTFKVTH